MKVVQLMMPADRLAEAVGILCRRSRARERSGRSRFNHVCRRQPANQAGTDAWSMLQRHTNLSLHVHGCTIALGTLSQPAAYRDRIVARSASAHGRFEISDPGGNIISLVEAG